MTFTNPNIILNGKDGWSLSIGNESIVSTSFKEEQKLMNDLSPSSNKVSVEISDWNKVSSIMTRQEDLRATFYDGTTPVFTGYLSNKSTWQLTDSGIKKMTLTFEDVGTRLLGKTFTANATGEEYVDSTLLGFVQRICSRCGIVLYTKEAKNVSIQALVNGKSTCKDILNQVMKETGYVYSFDNYGRMYLYQIPSSANASHTFDSSNLWTQNSSAVKSDRNIRKYERTRLEFDEYETAEGITVYKDISGKDEEYRNCKIEIPSQGTYPDTENGLPSTYSCTDIETGKEIISVSNVTPIVESIGEVVATIEKKNSKDISVLIKNEKTTSATVTRLEATADVVRVKGTTVILSGEAVEDSDSDNVYEMKLSYIHKKADAEETAKVLDWYYKYSDYSYEFYSKDDIAIGDVVRINEDSMSGLDVTILITEKIRKGNSDIITYNGVAYSPFKTTVIKDTTVNRPPVVIEGGSDGKDGTSVTISSTLVTYQLSDSGTTVPTGEWSTTVPTLTEGKYLWTKTEVTYSPSGSTVSYSVSYIGANGEDAKLLSINTYSTTITKNLRDDSTQTVRVDVIKSGYNGELVFRTSAGAVEGDNGSYIVVLPYNLDSVTFDAFSIVPSYGAFDSSIPYFKKNSEGVWEYYMATESDYLDCYMAEAWDTETLSSVDKTSYRKYMGVYDTVDKIPSNDVEGLIIDGDYALVRYNSNGDFLITAYELRNGSWVISSDPSILAETTSDAVNEAKAKYESGVDVNYIDLFYSHKAYIDNLSSTVINVSNINAGDIESFEYSEDSDGIPKSGYKLEYKGGSDASGVIKTVGMKASNSEFSNSIIKRDCQVYGTLINQDEDGNVVLKTEQSNLSVSTMSSSRKDGVNNPSAFLWSSYSSILKNRMTSRNANTIYNCTSTINGTSIKGYCNKTSVSDPPVGSAANVHDYSSGQTVDFPFGWTREESFSYTNKSSHERVTIRIKVPENFPTVKIRKLRICSNEYSTGQLWWQENYSEWYRLTVGSRQLAYFSGRSSGASWSPSDTLQQEVFENVLVYPGETIVAEIGGKFGFHCANFQISLYESDTWSTGLKLIGSNGTLYNFDSVVPSSGWGTSAQTFNDGGVNYSLSMEASSSWPVTKYYSFQWDSAPSSSTNKTTSFIADGSSMSYNGTSLNYSQIGSATYSTKGITLVSNTGNSYQFSVGGYYTQYSVSLTTQDSLLGIYAKNLMPVDTSSRIGGSDSAHLWQSIYCNTIYSNNSAPVSKRSLKENIKEWNGDALSLLNEVDIVEYNYISDPEKTYHIGFIADDTDERIAGKAHDRMDTTNCIGVLIKAIQELSDKIARLESQTNSNGGY